MNGLYISAAFPNSEQIAANVNLGSRILQVLDIAARQEVTSAFNPIISTPGVIIRTAEVTNPDNLHLFILNSRRKDVADQLFNNDKVDNVDIRLAFIDIAEQQSGPVDLIANGVRAGDQLLQVIAFKQSFQVDATEWFSSICPQDNRITLTDIIGDYPITLVALVSDAQKDYPGIKIGVFYKTNIDNNAFQIRQVAGLVASRWSGDEELGTLSGVISVRRSCNLVTGELAGDGNGFIIGPQIASDEPIFVFAEELYGFAP